MSAYYKFRQEELPTVAKFLYQYYYRDIIVFRDFSNEFDEGFATRYLNKIAHVDNLVNPITLTSELKKVTEDMTANMYVIRPVISQVQLYAQMASKDLKIEYKDFGCQQALKESRHKNVEGLAKWVHVILQNITNNQDVLSAKGFKDELGEKLQSIIQEIQAANQLQNQKMEERKQLVSNNLRELDELWVMMQKISRTGRVLFNYKDPRKKKDYMLSTLVKKVRSGNKPKEVKHTETTPPAPASTPQSIQKEPVQEPQQAEQRETVESTDLQFKEQ
ncbi:hypothetical protein DMA11_19380 [Marinilabiliaceae bacterium JC017]|nr:hypothetical protein DMA11_19380 [Marinilabiliaceae bacterium JC017]